MTKKDYELIAGCLLDSYNLIPANQLTKDAYITLVNMFIIRLSVKNPLFNKDKFILACGLADEPRVSN